MKKFLNDNGLKVVAIIMLLGALASSFGKLLTLPYVYYQLMNWAVAGSALMIVWRAHKSRKLFLMWLFTLVAVVFNPIASIYLRPFAWQIADIVVVVLFVASFFLVKEKRT